MVLSIPRNSSTNVHSTPKKSPPNCIPVYSELLPKCCSYIPAYGVSGVFSSVSLCHYLDHPIYTSDARFQMQIPDHSSDPNLFCPQLSKYGSVLSLSLDLSIQRYGIAKIYPTSDLVGLNYIGI
jgi:hypothetical protein